MSWFWRVNETSTQIVNSQTVCRTDETSLLSVKSRENRKYFIGFMDDDFTKWTRINLNDVLIVNFFGFLLGTPNQ